MKTKNKVISLIVVAVAVSATAAFAGFSGWYGKVAESPETVVEATKEKRPDKATIAVLNDLSGVMRRLDSVQVYTMTGVINAKDLADSSNSINANFTYQRNGNLFYYRVGESEMISLADMYINVDHTIQKIFVSAPVEMKNVFNTLPLDVNEFAKEEYEVTRVSEAGRTHVRMKQDQHIACREISVWYDSTGPVKRMFTRSTDPYRPDDRSVDKLTSVEVTRWQTYLSRAEVFDKNRYIRVEEDGYTAATSLAGYEVIISQ